MKDRELIISDNDAKQDIEITKAELEIAFNQKTMVMRDIPHIIKTCIKMIEMDDEAAASCIYALPRKVKNEKTGKWETVYIKGKTIKLAKLIASQWRNLRFGTRNLGCDGKVAKAMGMVWDLETRTQAFEEYEEDVKGTHGDAMRLAKGSARSKALRNAIFSVVTDFWSDMVFRAALARVTGSESDFPKRRQNLFNKFKNTGVPQERILAFYGVDSIENITQDMFQEMVGVGTMITDKVLKPEQVFLNVDDDIKENIDDLIAKKSISDKVSNDTINNETGEVFEKVIVNHAHVKKQLEDAKTVDDLNIAADLIKECEPQHHAQLTSLYHKRIKEVKQ